MRKQIFKNMCILMVAITVVTVGLIIVCAYFNFSTTETEKGFFNAVASNLWVIITFVLFGGAIYSLVASKYIVRKISDKTAAYDEISPLLEELDAQSTQIRENSSKLEQSEYGLRMITENMQEGLVLLGKRGLIATMNNSAKTLLEISDGDFTGMHIFAANRHPMLQAAVHTALGGSSCEELLDMSGRTVQIMANPVWADGIVSGVVLLVFDVTEKYENEQMRREFSANVSHELKTPLTSISGYAEIMKDGLVKQEDMSRFAGSIYNEAQRLIELIEDTIKLSRLDERDTEITRQRFDMHAAAMNVSQRLGDKAERYGVDFYVSGDACDVVGNRQLVEEIIYNLCDNAIKYNRQGGTVELITENTADGATLSVRDTGIGIPYEHQPRVFERFYRVDKSHSKETGGTGLGLSIVKHGAMFHNAEIEMESTPEVGTTIRLIFPKPDTDSN